MYVSSVIYLPHQKVTLTYCISCQVTSGIGLYIANFDHHSHSTERRWLSLVIEASKVDCVRTILTTFTTFSIYYSATGGCGQSFS